jgi:ankyrin repeat protein
VGIVRLLLESGADPTIRDKIYGSSKSGDSALTWAIKERKRNAVDFLLSKRIPFCREDISKAEAFLKAAPE